jgi:hypothetical protein
VKIITKEGERGGEKLLARALAAHLPWASLFASSALLCCWSDVTIGPSAREGLELLPPYWIRQNLRSIHCCSPEVAP